MAAGTLTRAQADAVLREATASAPSAAVPGAAPTADVPGPVSPLSPAATVPATATGAERPGWASVLAEVGGYVGGAFVLAGCVVLAGPNWESLSRATQLMILAGPAVALLVASTLIAASTPGGWSVKARPGAAARRRLIATLVTLAAALAAGSTAVVTGQNPRAFIAAGTALAVCGGGYLACRTALLNISTGVALSFTLAQAISLVSGHEDWQAWGFVLGGVLWATVATIGLLEERATGLALGCAMTYVGGEMVADMLNSGAGYGILGLLAVAGLWGYLRTRIVALLVVGVVALATVVPQSVLDYTDGALRAGGALLLTGVSIVGASVTGLALHRRTTPRHTGPPASI